MLNLKVVGLGAVAGAASTLIPSHLAGVVPMHEHVVPVVVGGAVGYLVGRHNVEDLLYGGVAGWVGGYGMRTFGPKIASFAGVRNWVPSDLVGNGGYRRIS